jgi:hypothetical protein
MAEDGSPTEGVETGAALAFAIAGDAVKAESLVPQQTLSAFSCLSHTLGEAYLASGQSTQLPLSSERILDHSGIVWNCWTGALAHQRLARC